MGALVLAGIFRVAQVWEAVVVSGAMVALGGYLVFRHEGIPPMVLVLTTVIAALVTPCVQIAYQWERAVLLRFGKFVGIRGSGVFLMVPVIDKVAQFVDQRIRASDFSRGDDADEGHRARERGRDRVLDGVGRGEGGARG